MSGNYNPEKFSILIIGAGFSGLCAAIQLKRKINCNAFTIFEENTDIGGTWFANTYPGCACDIAGHLYSLSFEPKTDWSSVYVSQGEILEYMKTITEKYGIYKHVRFRRSVSKMKWLEHLGQWKVTACNLDSNTETIHLFTHVICGTGIFHLPNSPEVFLNFKGSLIHTAKWDQTVDLEGRTVAVVGSGATAIQLIPEIAPKVKRLISYQRSPAWVIPRFQFNYPQWLKWTFKKLPGVRKSYRWLIFLMNELGHTAFQSRTILSFIGVPIGRCLGKALFLLQVNEPHLKEKLNPSPYLFGCKRICISNQYYPSLSLPHVKVTTSPIIQVSEDSITTEDGNTEKIDVLILATGFHVQEFLSTMKVYGKGSENILEKWKREGPQGYLGIFFSCMPNMFILQGPGSDLGHNSGIFTIECQTQMIMEVIEESVKRKARSISLKTSAEEEYMKKYCKKMKSTVWGNPSCNTNYKNSHGVVTSLYPETLISYWWNTKTSSIDTLFEFK